MRSPRSRCGSVCERVAREKSSKRRRSTTVRPTRPARAHAGASRGRRARRGSASMSAGDRGRAAERALRADRAPAAAALRPAAGRGCGRARADAGPTRARASRRARSSASRATSPTVVMPRSCSLPRRHRADAPEPLDRQRVEERRARASGGTTSSPSGLATPLATLARNFVRATPTVIGSPTRSRTSRRSRTAISSGEPDDPLHPAHVEERLVDREPLDERRRVVEDREHRLARLGVGRHARRHDDRVRAQPPRLPPPIAVRTPNAFAS